MNISMRSLQRDRHLRHALHAWCLRGFIVGVLFASIIFATCF